MTDMRSFRNLSPASRLFYGAESLRRLPDELARLGCRRALVFCGRTIAHRTRGLELVRAALGDRYAGEHAGVQAHSPLPAVLAGVEALRSHDADAIVAVGGGSATVTARAAAILLAEDRDIRELCTQFAPGRPPESPKLNRPKLPQLVVPTTATTAYPKAGSAVVDPAAGQRRALFDPKTRPAAIFLHPEIVLTAPPELALVSAVEAFALAVQGLEARSSQPFSDSLLIHAARLLLANIPKVLADAQDAEARGQTIVAGIMAGLGTDAAPAGLGSVIGHVLGARHGVDTGKSNAIVLPHTIRFNAPATGERLVTIAAALGVDATTGEAPVTAIGSALRSFFDRIGIPARLREVGVAESGLPQLANDAMDDWFLHQNPRRVGSSEEVLEVLRAAW